MIIKLETGYVSYHGGKVLSCKGLETSETNLHSATFQDRLNSEWGRDWLFVWGPFEKLLFFIALLSAVWISILTHPWAITKVSTCSTLTSRRSLHPSTFSMSPFSRFSPSKLRDKITFYREATNRDQVKWGGGGGGGGDETYCLKAL